MLYYYNYDFPLISFKHYEKNLFEFLKNLETSIQIIFVLQTLTGNFNFV